MSTLRTTCWTLIRGAADGSGAFRAEFVATYGAAVRRVLRMRWGGSARIADVEDASQDVFLECFRAGGVLDRVADGQVASFRKFLFGVVRNVARRHESRPVVQDHLASDLIRNGPLDLDADLGTIFDREWARLVVRLARERLESGTSPLARKRAELLRLRYEESMPIRDIAAAWKEDPATLHHQFADAKAAFAAVLRAIVAEQVEGGTQAVEEELRFLLGKLAQG